MTNLQADTSPHLTVRQLAARWHTTPQAIYVARHRGKAPKGFKRGVMVLFPIIQVEEFESNGMANDRPSNRESLAEHRPPEPRRRRRTAPKTAK